MNEMLNYYHKPGDPCMAMSRVRRLRWPFDAGKIQDLRHLLDHSIATIQLLCSCLGERKVCIYATLYDFALEDCLGESSR